MLSTLLLSLSVANKFVHHKGGQSFLLRGLLGICVGFFVTVLVPSALFFRGFTVSFSIFMVYASCACDLPPDNQVSARAMAYCFVSQQGACNSSETVSWLRLLVQRMILRLLRRAIILWCFTISRKLEHIGIRAVAYLGDLQEEFDSGCDKQEQGWECGAVDGQASPSFVPKEKRQSSWSLGYCFGRFSKSSSCARSLVRLTRLFPSLLLLKECAIQCPHVTGARCTEFGSSLLSPW